MRKYCLFEGGDVVGPFSAQELLKRAGFGSHSLVCPDEYSDEEAYWKEASAYEEFGFAPQEVSPEAKTEAAAAAQSEQFLKEMDSVMSELSSFHVGEKKPVLMDNNKTVTEPEDPSSTEKEEKKQEEIPLPQETDKKEEKTQTLTKTGGKTTTEKTSRKISALLLQASEEMKKNPEPVAQKHVEAAVKPAPTSQMPVLPQQPEEETPQEQTVPQAEPELPAESVVRTISKVNPLEEYFNTMRSGDLGNILGIPDPKENSDMSLARALQNQFEKTEPDIKSSTETEDPFDEFAPKAVPEEIDENLFSEKTLVESDQETHARLMGSLPDLQKAAPLKVAGQGPSKLEEPVTQPPEIDPEQDPENTEPPTLQEVIVPEQEDDPNDRTVKTILEGTLRVDTQRREIPEPIKDVPAEEAKEPIPAQAPAVSDGEEDFLQDRVVKQKSEGKWKFVFMIFGALLLLLGVLLNWLGGGDSEQTSSQNAAVQEEQQPATLKSSVSARDVIAAMQAQETKDPVELAKELVQQYPLGNGQGTIENYLQQRYQKELQSGYAAFWSAEPLHKDVYVVKYRLAKTRKEPIVYIFQVDTAKKKLTGALNNITLDLVGKIR